MVTSPVALVEEYLPDKRSTYQGSVATSRPRFVLNRRCLLLLLAPFLFFLALLIWQHQLLGGSEWRAPRRLTTRRTTPLNQTVEEVLRSPSSPPTHTQTLRRNGPSLAAVDLVFLSEAYTADSAAEFFADVAHIVNTHFAGSGAFASIEPLFNVHALFSPSAEARIATSEAPTADNRTAFGCYREPNKLRGIFPGDATVERAAAICEVRLGCSSCDFMVLLVNDPWYGGLAEPAVTIITNSRTTGAQSTRHELVHAFADLGEECAKRLRCRRPFAVSSPVHMPLRPCTRRCARARAARSLVTLSLTHAPRR